MPELAVTFVAEGELIMDDGRTLSVDERGYLTDRSQWDRRVAERLAQDEDIELTPEHWAVIELLRNYYASYEIEPPMRALVKLVGRQLGKDRGNSRFLYRLFPDGPTTQGSRIAGLPRPLSCI